MGWCGFLQKLNSTKTIHKLIKYVGLVLGILFVLRPPLHLVWEEEENEGDNRESVT